MGQAYGAKLRAAIVIMALSVMALSVADPIRAQSPVSEAPPPTEAAQICVVVPHFKDEYWLSVGHGLIEEARAQNVGLLTFESGGYHALIRQIDLLNSCVRAGARAILLGAVSADDPRLLEAVDRTARDVPVIALVNALHSPALSGSVGVDWTDMGRAIGRHLSERYPAGGPTRTALLITGPAASGWSPLLEKGLAEAMAASAVKIARIGRSDTGAREQLRATEAALAATPDANMIIGSAPAIEGAMGLAAVTNGTFPELIATYISHSVRRGLQNGTVQAVAFDDPVAQGRLGIRLALIAKPGLFRTDVIGPEIKLITTDNITQIPVPLSPAGLNLGLE
ncbi:TMAO reductase system periplasmic protein TorT [Aliiroseovarius crassostreae]|uniref:TMAO reductase system periplasmic protein TorT n=1 Tax=Aliiroseovarius crassostreae TaxID=154981 RepID=UPI0021FF8C19|nr:TMAO reductase system periplasmic protein TorT [Aliiroseovarius crassostreae]UWQ02801.1 TMAO reductase system periplasmic protein TorT [Aliiroseovarius crassostreae]